MLARLIGDLRCSPPLERGGDEMGRLLTAAARSYADWKPSLPVRPGGYTRTCLYYDDRFEVLLLNWSERSSSQLHDHGGQHCWLAVLDGQFHIENYDRVDSGDVPGRAIVLPRTSATLERGDVDLRSGPHDIHRVVAGNTNAVSLHVYSRPLSAFTVFDEFAQRCETVRGRYDAILAHSDIARSHARAVV